MEVRPWAPQSLAIRRIANAPRDSCQRYYPAKVSLAKTIDAQYKQFPHFVVSLSIVFTVPQPTGCFFSWLVVLFEAQLMKAKSPNIRKATINPFFMEKPSIFLIGWTGVRLPDQARWARQVAAFKAGPRTCQNRVLSPLGQFQPTL